MKGLNRGFCMKWIKRILLFIVLIIVIVVIVIFLNGKKMYDNVLEQSSLAETIEEIQNDEDYVKIEDLPEYYINAVVAVEDHRYYSHGAIDIIAIGRALWVNITNFSLQEGGSTITQQVAKNILFIEETDVLARKAAEILAAIDLEENYTKDEILELYVNTIYFGDGYYGIKEACNGYLDIEPSEMTLYDATMMAGIPNAPSIYAPTVNPDLTRSRQEKVVACMVEYGYLSQEEADDLLEEK